MGEGEIRACHRKFCCEINIHKHLVNTIRSGVVTPQRPAPRITRVLSALQVLCQNFDDHMLRDEEEKSRIFSRLVALEECLNEFSDMYSAMSSKLDGLTELAKSTSSLPVQQSDRL